VNILPEYSFGIELAFTFTPAIPKKNFLAPLYQQHFDNYFSSFSPHCFLINIVNKIMNQRSGLKEAM